MNSAKTFIISKKPSDLYIDRDPSWKNTPREVGDGMEDSNAHQLFNTSINNLSQGMSLNCSGYSLGRSRSPSPPASPYSGGSFLVKEELPASCISESIISSSSDAALNPSVINGSEKFLVEEKNALKDHLQIQIQVNQELKRLLVASVGDDLGYHYERLSTEKAQLSLELDELKKKIEMKDEELERLEISCDIWRSKFRASRVQCDDLSAWKRIHERQMRELETAVRGLLREHWERSDHIAHIYSTLKLLNVAVTGKKEETSQSNKKQRNESTTKTEKCRELVNALANEMLEPFVFQNKTSNVSSPTPAEKYVLQLLSEYQRTSSFKEANKMSTMNRGDREMDRAHNALHPYIGSDNITMNCCDRCVGEIHLV